MRISIKLKRKLPSIETVRRAWIIEAQKHFDRIGARHVKEREARTTTWRRKPAFAHQTGTGNYRVSLVVYLPYPNEHISNVWHWLDKGTRIRYATMTGDFRAKTAPGRRTPRAGRGGVLFVSKRKPRPGIQARRFERDIIKKLEKPTIDGLKRAGQRAFKRKRLPGIG